MSRTRSRARNRDARLEKLRAEASTEQRQALLEELREEVAKAREDDAEARKPANRHRPEPGHGALWSVLCRINRSDLPLWKVVAPLDEEEQAMILDQFERRLAGRSRSKIRLLRLANDEAEKREQAQQR